MNAEQFRQSLHRLVSTQDDVTHYNESGDTEREKDSQNRRNALSKKLNWEYQGRLLERNQARGERDEARAAHAANLAIIQELGYLVEHLGRPDNIGIDRWVDVVRWEYNHRCAERDEARHWAGEMQRRWMVVKRETERLRRILWEAIEDNA